MAAPQRLPDAGAAQAQRLRRTWRALQADERTAALAALALWVSMFLPWYGKSVTETVRGSLRAASHTLSAFGAFSFVEAAVLLVATSVLALLFARAERRAFHLPGGDGTVILLAGVWTGLLVFYRMLDKPRTTGTAQLTTTIGLRWGIFVAIAGAIGLAYAGTRLRAARRPEPTRMEDSTLRPPRAPTRTRRAEDRSTRAPTRIEEEADQLTFEIDPVEVTRRPRTPPVDGERLPERDVFGER